MSKLFIVNPLALLGAKLGYNRPLDRHDWDGKGGHVPGWAGAYAPGLGEVRRFSNLTGFGNTATGANTVDNSSTQKHPLGTLAVTRDGRFFRYCQVGATDTVTGSIYQSAAPVANHLANTPPAVAAGATSFSYTPGATAGAANLYAEGTLMVDTTPGNGATYRVSGHAAIASSTAFNLYLDPDDPIEVALTTSSRVGLHTHPHKNVIVAATTVTAPAVGGAPVIITATYFGWLQTKGPFAALINGTPGVGIGVVTSATTAGAVDVAAVAAEINVRRIGRMMQVGVSTKNNAVYLELD